MKTTLYDVWNRNMGELAAMAAPIVSAEWNANLLYFPLPPASRVAREIAKLRAEGIETPAYTPWPGEEV